MSKVLSMRMREEQMERLQRVARRLGRTPSETSALLVEEGLRQAEFAHIEFRDSAVGRQAYVKGSRVAVWQVVQIARAYGMNVEKTAEHLQWPALRVQAALNYAAAFPEEIEAAIQDNASYDFETISRMLPQVERFVVKNEDD